MLETKLGYTEEHARMGLEIDYPAIECWPNQFPRYEVTIDFQEFTSICPKTSLPDFGKIIIQYMPDVWCAELKSLKLYLNAYRNVGIFQENALNRILRDFVQAVQPLWVVVKGEFNARGGMGTTMEAKYSKDDGQFAFGRGNKK